MIRYPDTAPLPEIPPKRNDCDGRSHTWELDADSYFSCNCGAGAEITPLKDGWEKLVIFQPPQRFRCEHGNWKSECVTCLDMLLLRPLKYYANFAAQAQAFPVVNGLGQMLGVQWGGGGAGGAGGGPF
jgi:hypothetical protein